MPETARGDQGRSHAPSSRPGGEANAYGAVRSWNEGGLDDVVPRRKPDPDYLQGSAPHATGTCLTIEPADGASYEHSGRTLPRRGSRRSHPADPAEPVSTEAEFSCRRQPAGDEYP